LSVSAGRSGVSRETPSERKARLAGARGDIVHGLSGGNFSGFLIMARD